MLYVIYLVATLGIAGLIVLLWRRQGDPLIPLVPVALTFPPLIAYGGGALGWPGAWLSTRVALVFCLLIFLVFRVVRRDFSYHRIPGIWFVAPHLLLVIASVLWSVLGPYNGEAGAIANELLSWVIIVTIFLFIAGSAHGEADLRLASRVLIGVGLGAAVYSGFQALALAGSADLVPSPIADLTEYGRKDLFYAPNRLYGTLPNLGPNFFGAFLLVPTVLAFSRAFSQRRFLRVAWLLGGLAGVVVIAGTYSRGAMLGLFLALLMLPFWRRSACGAATVTAAIAVIGLAVAQTPIGRHVAATYAAGQLDVSGSARVYLWKAILSNAADRPFGLGFNGWPRESRSNMDVGFTDLPASIGSGHPAENQWIRELADRGLPGVLALAFLLGGVMRLTFLGAHPKRSNGYSQDFLAAAGAACVGWSGAFLTGDHLMYDNVAGMFWYAVALALVATRTAAQSVEPEHGSVSPAVPLAGSDR
jgi:O-Antigen ligase